MGLRDVAQDEAAGAKNTEKAMPGSLYEDRASVCPCVLDLKVPGAVEFVDTGRAQPGVNPFLISVLPTASLRGWTRQSLKESRPGLTCHTSKSLPSAVNPRTRKFPLEETLGFRKKGGALAWDAEQEVSAWRGARAMLLQTSTFR